MRYERSIRHGKLGVRTKLSQGIGAVPDTIKNWVFNTFTLLFYNQVLGVDAFMVSVALAIAIVFDAVTDPMVATLSDNLHTRWGRRHPLMLIASIPLGLCLFAVFVPPAGLGPAGLFGWLLTFTILTRGFMTLYFVPWAAIAAELSDDYVERTSVMAYRFAIGWTVGVSFPLIVFSVFMVSTEAYPVGQLNPAGYPAMAALAGCLMASGALATTLLTWREIPYLRKHADAPPAFGFVQILRELGAALRYDQFALIFVILLMIGAIGGTTANIGIYMMTFFWGLSGEHLRWFAFSALGAVLAFPLVAIVQRRWEKKQILFTCAIIGLADGIILVLLRFMGILPENGDPLLLVILVCAGALSAGIAVIQGIIGASIIADLLDEHELNTGQRQEAMFNAALSFSGKATSGLGVLVGGLVITMIAFPTQLAPAEITPDKVFHLGLVVGILVPLLYLIPASLIRKYRITRARHAEIRAALAARAAATSDLA
ncbi:sugar transporter [Parvibaculum lavamentivorans DS-1]|uniref:Sugar transporter n=1 Tax=Parvibaculum lavamentivorans (strain DS-1 / DSM 13023 / NCIMB 13966) TaxID=402881 RepID=A7HX27_PARL1|nr:MFS transporter [Parvibaculum lavamentivorans]ABS64460.1 sugar transporter [Parvibaculum lavamentivorans DS-1]